MWLPTNLPRLPTWRGKFADAVLVGCLLVARYGFVVGALAGASGYGVTGFGLGFAGGWLLGLWTSRSLGLRRRRLEHGFVVRMLERGDNDRAKFLESLVEWLRGYRLGPKQCLLIAAAYAEATRRLQTCESRSERNEILGERKRKVWEAAYGRHINPAATARGEASRIAAPTRPELLVKPTP